MFSTEYLMPLCVIVPMIAAPVVYSMRRRSQKLGDGLTSLVCLAVLAFAVMLAGAGECEAAFPDIFMLGVSFAGSGLRSVFGLLCAFMFFMSSLSNPAYFAGEHKNERYDAFMLLTLGGIMGVFYAGDLFTLYICFETMSLASWVWVGHNENEKAQRAADTYLTMAMIGGLVMLYGLFGLHDMFGTLDIASLAGLSEGCAEKGRLFVLSLCLLVGFGIKAGMYPFHVWLPKAHPVAPAPSSALLSGILTKSGIFGILIIVTGLLWGDHNFMLLLLALGCVTMVLGAVLAVFSTDLKRTLACSSLSQIGFILVGAAMLTIGHESDLAAAGIVTHALNHGLTKLVLFISAGVIYKHKHTLDLNKLKGAGRSCLPLKICFLLGALSIAGVPGFGGYVSKTLLHEGIVHQMHHGSHALHGILEAAEVMFLFSGGLTAAYMTKLFVKIFVQSPDNDKHPVTIDKGSLIAILPAALALLGMGIFPAQTYERAAAAASEALRCAPVSVGYFEWVNLKGAVISLCIGAAVYFVFVRGLLTDHRTGEYTSAPRLLDLEDDIYRPLIRANAFVGAFLARVLYGLTDGFALCMTRLMNLGAAKRVTPGEDHHFGRYSKEYVRAGAIGQTLSFELMLFGIGVVVVLVYLMFRA
ncbi:MAG: NADH dehydrogenase [Clostridia bacterium]|nr:NADH dehydrogenase [Clostridia bacterium]